MVTLDWDLDRADGVTFVRAYVTARRARRVRVENRLDGPVWPPRRRGQPAAGWEDGGFEGVTAPGERLVGGYATPAPPREPPVELVVADPVDCADDGDATPGVTDWNASVPAVEPTPGDIVRTLGNPVVPRDAVPLADDGATDSGADAVDSPDGRTGDTGGSVPQLLDAVDRALGGRTRGR